ncbi:BrnT family toxin [Marinihelvus fidelis]|uniref:BrnT family toxin n=1 Tax=Marinihelvus fidelis TaxID=2613842 RepID=A0A5N0T478_9GAMM|nr:BrnT family toxin [Marinihelvus fidelis]KAA9129662.1 BrnT family toxin [Marinihelvus fidelis]
MKATWDPYKATSNLKKHGVDFADAVIALEDMNALTIEDVFHDEQRFKSLGKDSGSHVLLVVFSYEDQDTVRLISARRADRSEIQQYYQGVNHE